MDNLDHIAGVYPNNHVGEQYTVVVVYNGIINFYTIVQWKNKNDIFI